MFSPFQSAMSRPNPGSNPYQRMAVESVVAGDGDPHRLVQMLFDGALGSIAKARGALREGQIATKASEISRAVRILDEGLKASLDDKGGEVTQNLRTLYAYLIARLTHANLRNDDDALAECARLLQPVADGWRDMRATLPRHAN